MKATRKMATILIICIIVVSAVVAVYVSRLRMVSSISLAPSTLVAVQGTQIAFTIFGLEPDGVATVYFGDGHQANTTSTVTYAYQTAGRYLVAAEEFINGQSAASTFGALQTIQVTPQVSMQLAPLISVPVISFDASRNPAAPVAQAGEDVYFYGGYQEQPSGTNVTITRYDWDFGNAATRSIPANMTSLNPTENPMTTTYDQPGLYAVRLTLVTENSTRMTTYDTSLMQTVAIGSTSQHYAVFLYQGSVPDPSVVNVAEVQPGGPYSFDPNTDGETVGDEIIYNVYGSLLVFNGSSTTSYIPMVAAQVPSVSNGEISPDLSTYTFKIRNNLRFSNGDPLTSYDVWYSIIRMMLFAANPSDWDWSVANLANSTDTADFNTIMKSVTYSNSSNTVTVDYGAPIPPKQFFSSVAYLPGILDAKWLEQVGAGITFTPAGFYDYQNQAFPGNYNQQVQWAPVASGPYMVQSYAPGQSITLVPNPGFQGVPGIPAVNNTVIIKWLKDQDTAYLLFKSGQVDIVSGLIGLQANNYAYVPKISQLVATDQATIYQFPTQTIEFFCFNLEVNETLMKTDFGIQYHIPSGYFTNLNIRKAFAYAFNYTNFIDVIQGNQRFGLDFGDPYAGGIPPGASYYTPETQLQNVPTFNLTYAKELLQRSGEYNVSVNFPIVVLPGDQEDLAAAQMWAVAINSIDPNIVMTPTEPSSYPIWWDWQNPGMNPMPLYNTWYAGSASTWGNLYNLYVGGGFQAAADEWYTKYLNLTGHPDEATMHVQINLLSSQESSTANDTRAALDCKKLLQTAIDLYMYVYTAIPSGFWVVKPYMTGYRGQVSYEMNPIIAGGLDGLYYWWVKGCENPQACMGRNIGP